MFLQSLNGCQTFVTPLNTKKFATLGQLSPPRYHPVNAALGAHSTNVRETVRRRSRFEFCASRGLGCTMRRRMRRGKSSERAPSLVGRSHTRFRAASSRTFDVTAKRRRFLFSACHSGSDGRFSKVN